MTLAEYLKSLAIRSRAERDPTKCLEVLEVRPLRSSEPSPEEAVVERRIKLATMGEPIGVRPVASSYLTTPDRGHPLFLAAFAQAPLLGLRSLKSGMGGLCARVARVLRRCGGGGEL